MTDLMQAVRLANAVAPVPAVMTETMLAAIGTVIVSVVSGILGALILFWAKYRTTNSDLTTKEKLTNSELDAKSREQLNTSFMLLFNQQQTQINALQLRVETDAKRYEAENAAAQTAHVNCLRENAELRGEIRAMHLRMNQNQVEAMKEIRSDLRTERDARESREEKQSS